MSQETEDSQQVVSVSNVGKKFAKGLGQTLRYGLEDIGRDLLMQKEAPRFLCPREFWVLDYHYRSYLPLPQPVRSTSAPPEKAIASIVSGT